MLTSPGFLQLLLTLGIMAVAQRTFMESLVKAIVTSVELISLVRVKYYPGGPSRACMKSRWEGENVTISRFQVAARFLNGAKPCGGRGCRCRLVITGAVQG